MLLCHKQGYAVCKPFGDKNKYDFIIDVDGDLQRIQVKGTNFRDNRGTGDSYSVILASGRTKKTRYTSDEIDYFVIYVIPEDTWYKIPVDVVKSKSINLYPHRQSKKNLYEKYKIKFNETNWKIFSG